MLPMGETTGEASGAGPTNADHFRFALKAGVVCTGLKPVLDSSLWICAQTSGCSGCGMLGGHVPPAIARVDMMNTTFAARIPMVFSNEKVFWRIAASVA